jgi:Uracil DNA glycosylase superfamily
MLIGEQPGDVEDRTGHPFVGPAGKLLNEALETIGVDRRAVYMTNAVKHFKWEPRGKLRLHEDPSAREVAACRPWLWRRSLPSVRSYSSVLGRQRRDRSSDRRSGLRNGGARAEWTRWTTDRGDGASSIDRADPRCAGAKRCIRVLRRRSPVCRGLNRSVSLTHRDGVKSMDSWGIGGTSCNGSPTDRHGEA